MHHQLLSIAMRHVLDGLSKNHVNGIIYATVRLFCLLSISYPTIRSISAFLCHQYLTAPSRSPGTPNPGPSPGAPGALGHAPERPKNLPNQPEGTISRWWFFTNPSEKYDRQIGFHFPKHSG